MKDESNIEISKEVYEKFQQALEDMNTGFLSANDFINHQIRNLLEKHRDFSKRNTAKNER